jgi:hypothetical protein
MKPNQTSGDDPSLSRLLHEWTVDRPLPPRFQEQVWQRVSRTETQPRPGWWASLARLLEARLPRPAVAGSYLALLLAVGVATGTWAAQIKASHLQADLRQRYVQSVDPFRGPVSPP